MNRALWTAIGAVLLAAGVLGLLAGEGALPGVDRQRSLLTPELINAWNRNETLATALTIGGGVLLALLGALLLRAQLRRPGGAPMSDLHLPRRLEPAPAGAPDVERGSTEVASRALRRALQNDLESVRQIRDASVRLTGSTEHPRLSVRLAVTPDADLARLAGQVDHAVHRFVSTSGVEPEHSDVVVRIPQRTTTRVG